MKCWLRLLQWQYEDISSPSDAYVFELSWEIQLFGVSFFLECSTSIFFFPWTKVQCSDWWGWISTPVVWHIKSGRSHVPNGILLLYLHFSLLLFSFNPSLCVCSPFDLSLFQGFVAHQNFKSNRASLLGEEGEWRDEPKAHQQIIIRSRVLRNSYLEGFSSCSKFLWLPLLLWS